MLIIIFFIKYIYMDKFIKLLCYLHIEQKIYIKNNLLIEFIVKCILFFLGIIL